MRVPTAAQRGGSGPAPTLICVFPSQRRARAERVTMMRGSYSPLEGPFGEVSGTSRGGVDRGQRNVESAPNRNSYEA